MCLIVKMGQCGLCGDPKNKNNVNIARNEKIVQIDLKQDMIDEYTVGD